jgi:glycosyltransferase involved in cell wall biosynthesis
MHLLYLSPTLPIPTSGGRTRVFNLIKHLSERHEITVLSFLQPVEEEWLPQLEPYCAHLELVPFAGFEPPGKWANRINGWRRILFSRRPRYVHTFPVESMRDPLRSLLAQQNFDIVAFEALYLVELMDEISDTPVLLVEQNVESDLRKRALESACNPLHRCRDWLMWRKLLKFEKHYLNRFPVVVAVSDRDAELLSTMSPSARVSIVPNGVDSETFRPPADISRVENTLFFFGTLNYAPNVEGILWFVNEIWPRIRDSRPQVRLEIAGIDPVADVAALDRYPGVDVVGFVPDIRVRLWTSQVCVVPLLTGGGTRLKILESMAAGCPVVSTSIGAEGLDLQAGEHLLVADSAETFAAQVLSLLESSELQHALVRKAQRLVALKYDWSTIAERFEAELENAHRDG